MSSRLKHTALCCAAALTVCFFGLPAFALDREPEETVPSLSLKAGEVHTAFLQGFADGTIRPDAPITRAEAAQMVYSLLDDPRANTARNAPADVPDTAYYADAVRLFAARGLLDCPEGLASPERNITRAEFVHLLSGFLPEGDAECPFSDITPDMPCCREVSLAYACGWVKGTEEMEFSPDGELTRAEAAAILNRALGRSADVLSAEDLAEREIWPDLPRTHWAWGEILEAGITHSEEAGTVSWEWPTAARLPGGLVTVGQDLYYVDPSGDIVRDGVRDGLYFAPGGYYTSGDLEIDAYVKSTLEAVTTPEMTREEKLRAAYTYTRDSFTYLRRNYYQIGDTGWTEQEARTMFETGRGNCYCYTSVFYYLARQLGYDAVAVSGVVGTDRSPHAWAEIAFDGKTYIFDPELEMAQRNKGYYYNLYHLSYQAIPWPYVK